LNRAFDRLPPEKRERIIDAAIAEFAQKGYTLASTDSITEKAAISKGAVFYYFKSKKNLFLYILDHAVEVLLSGMISRIREIESRDFFTRVKEMVLARISATVQYSNETRLLIKAFSETPAEMEKELHRVKMKQFVLVKQWRQEFLYPYFDRAGVRKNVPVENAINLIDLVFEQLGLKYIQMYRGREHDLLDNPQPLLDELDTYIDLIKHGIFSAPQ
jgi:TetR/AcrR family transcriptional regulator